MTFSLTAYSSSSEEEASFDDLNDVISDKLDAGRYLIYDCQEKHWVCVLESYYKDCELRRSMDAKSDSVHHSCAPVGALPSKKSCFQRVLYLTSQHVGTRFCVKDQWKKKSVKF